MIEKQLEYIEVLGDVTGIIDSVGKLNKIITYLTESKVEGTLGEYYVKLDVPDLAEIIVALEDIKEETLSSFEP